MLIDRIKQIARDIHPLVIARRRHLHAHPELSFQEKETSAYIKKQLSEMGIPWQPVADNGVVALIRGGKLSDRVVALRADIDALPIHEQNAVEYRSTCTGVMHACGHDAHTASLLGTAHILQALREEFGGTVKLIFQPGEEKLPGGASLMIREGVLENPRPEGIIGQHCAPALEAGKIAVRPGKFMASMDELQVWVRGKGGHAAQPHQNIDPVVIAAHIIVALQQIVSRQANPTHPSVLSFGRVIADGAINVIPDEVHLEGTLRTMDEAWRAKAHELMVKMASGIAESMGGSCEFRIVKGYPYLLNNEALTSKIRRYAESYLGEDQVVEADLWMAAEDFAYYTQATSGCFYLLGTGNSARGINSALHSPTFDIDESALEISTGLMAFMALKELGY